MTTEKEDDTPTHTTTVTIQVPQFYHRSVALAFLKALNDEAKRRTKGKDGPAST